MRTAVIEVSGLISPLSSQGVEKQLSKLRGIEKASVNYASGSATVTFDEKEIGLVEIETKIAECGYHCGGELLPKHLCEKEQPKTGSADHTKHNGHGKKAAELSEDDKQAATDHTAHEMGHGGGMDMAEMVKDMRNRFWIALVFAIPIFIYSPMGGLFTPPAPPLGLRLDLWLFFLGSAAIVYPSWPFFVAAS